MTVSLKSLPDALRGAAWPPSARAVRCPVKSGNERDPHSMLPESHFGGFGTRRGPLVINQGKERATVGQYGPNALGYTRPTMAGTKRCDPERGS